MQTTVQENKPQIKWHYLFTLLLLFLLTVSATYTWFSLSKTPRVNDVGMFISSPVGLELSWDRTENSWGQHLDYTDVYPDGATLKPVTWSENNQCFYAAVFGIDGRIESIANRLFDTEHINRNDPLGYYMKIIFFARSDEDVSVSLTPANPVGDSTDGTGTYVIGTPVWNPDNILHDNGGSGADCSIRLGFRITHLDAEGNPRTDINPAFYIYEPNCDKHISGAGGYYSTPSVDSGEIPLISENRLITQTATSFSETEPVTRDSVIYSFGEFLSDTKLFELAKSETAQIELYLWLEGQDIDCTNSIGENAQIFASILFSADYGAHPGPQPIG